MNMQSQNDSPLFIQVSTEQYGIVQWTWKPQECTGGYLFNGQYVVSKGVSEAIDFIEILALQNFVKRLVKLYGSLDYFQVFTCSDGRKVWIIDNFSTERKSTMDQEALENDYYTMLLPTEY